MIVLLTTLTTGFMAFTLYMVFCLDDWLGVLAFKYQYLGFCALAAGLITMAWFGKSKRLSAAVGLIAFTALISPYFLNEPSSRILRHVLVDVQPGMHADEVEQWVRHAYSESDYAMPRIIREDNRLFVSLTTQAPGDCTAAIFYLTDGVVVSDEFSAD